MFGQLFDVILAGVSMDEVGSASGVLNAIQQLAAATGVAVVGSVYFAALAERVPTAALQTTALLCLIPLAATFLLAFRLPPRARAER